MVLGELPGRRHMLPATVEIQQEPYLLHRPQARVERRCAGRAGQVVDDPEVPDPPDVPLRGEPSQAAWGGGVTQVEVHYQGGW